MREKTTTKKSTVKKSVLTSYFMPTLGFSIKAKSLAEAYKKAEKNGKN